MNRLIALSGVAILVVACAAPARTPLPTGGEPPAPTLAQATAKPTTPVPSATATAPATPAAATPSPTAPAPSVSGSVTLVTHDSFAATDSVISDFESQTGMTLKVLKGGDAGAMVNQAILTKNDPLGDVLYGVDNTFLSRALDAGIFVPYVSPAAANIPAEFKLDPQNRVTPIDYGDVCINYDAKAVGATGSPTVPQTINDLTKPEYKSTLVVENPATSSPGLAFMLASIVRFGESGDYTWLDYWKDLKANDVLVVPDWNSAYYNEFSGGGDGDRPFVVSYATDPAAAIYFDGAESGTPGVQAVVDGCFRQIEFAAVLAGAANPTGAQAWVDYMASVEFQSDMPLNMFVFPVNPEAQVPELFSQYAAVVPDPLTMDPAAIAANRDRWIQEWTDTVLH
jgi:thiamine transport system substrate-binding protein